MKLAAESLAFGHRRRIVGRALDFSFSTGEVVCVLGPNGAGKSTLFRTLLGLTPALGGRVTLEGRDLASLSRAQVARALAYVPQASASYFDFTLAELVEMGRAAHLGLFAAPGAKDREAARAALERLGIGAIAQQRVGAVSGGERQLALIARALATEAPLLILDEPTANLDFANQARVLKEVARLRDAGIGILFGTHDPDHALEVADRALLLREGKVMAAGNAADTITAAHLSALYALPVTAGRPRFRA